MQPTAIIANVKMYPQVRQIHIDDTELKLTGLEFNLLSLLMGASPEIVTRADIAARVFYQQLSLCDNKINTHISNLKVKLSKGQGSVCIKTQRGKGYLLSTH